MNTKTIHRIAALIVLLTLLSLRSSAQGVGISESSITPDASAILELRYSSGTYKGLLLPRMSTANRNSISGGAPPAGLTLYNSTTNTLDLYNGGWVSLAPLVSPSFTTPSLGAATATSINKVTLTAPATGSTLTIADGKTLTASNTLTFTGTDGSSVAFGAGGTATYTSNDLSVFSATTSAQLAGILSDEQGSGQAVFATSPTLTTPVLGVASATSINKVAITAPATGSTLTIADGKTLTASNTLSFTGTDGSSVAFGAGGTATYTSNNLSVFSATTSAQLAGVLSDEQGSGQAVFATSPQLTGVSLAAGTNAVDPLTFTSGTNLTVPASGAMEYDGSTFYNTTASGRGVMPSVQIATIQSAFTLTNGAGVQSCFTTTHDVLTVQANTTYLFEGQYIIGNGTTSHTTAMAFALGGASVTSFEYTATLWSSALNTIATAQSTTQVSGVASKVLNAASTAATTTIQFQGVARINAGGTITPQINFSAAPGGTNQMKLGSYIKFTPIGTGSVTAVGAWN